MKIKFKFDENSYYSSMTFEVKNDILERPKLIVSDIEYKIKKYMGHIKSISLTHNKKRKRITSIDKCTHARINNLVRDLLS